MKFKKRLLIPLAVVAINACIDPCTYWGLSSGTGGVWDKEACAAKRSHAEEKTFNAELKNAEKIQPLAQCQHEVLSATSPETQSLYQYALHQDLNLHRKWENEINKKAKEGVFDEVIRFYRIASENGNYMATIRLNQILERAYPYYNQQKDAKERERNHLYALMNKQLPTGYVYIDDVDSKAYSLQPKLSALANQGNLNAQAEVGRYLWRLSRHIEDNPKAQNHFFQMSLPYLHCAAEKNHPYALEVLANIAENDGKADLALTYQHKAYKYGNSLSSLELEKNAQFDDERKARYTQIKRIQSKLLTESDEARLPFSSIEDLDEIVPLPPAPLPKWNGTIKLQRWLEGAPPAKPSEKVVAQLAEKAGLDLKTGLPIAAPRPTREANQ